MKACHIADYVRNAFKIPARTRRRNKTASLAVTGIECLEDRRLLAAVMTDDAGVLQVDGTGGNDVITVEETTGITGYQLQWNYSPYVGIYASVVPVYGDVIDVMISDPAGAVVLHDQFDALDITAIDVDGLDGNDRIENYTSLNSTLKGGSGNDTLRGGSGNDRLIGSMGNDTYVFSGSRLGSDDVFEFSWQGSADMLDFSQFGGSVNVNLASTADQTVNTGDLILDLSSSWGIERVRGSAFGDTIRGNVRDNIIWGMNGYNSLFGGDGNDILVGGNQNDRLEGGSGNDRLTGGMGNDRYVFSGSRLGTDDVVEYSWQGTADLLDFRQFTGSVDVDLANTLDQSVNTGDLVLDLSSSWGIERVYGSAYDDTIRGNVRNNFFSAMGGNDVLHGGDGNDTLVGGFGDDDIYAGAGADWLYGQSGNDGLIGGDGNDYLSGGSDADRFLVMIDGNGDPEDNVVDLSADDAQINLVNGAPYSYSWHSEFTYDAAAGSWTDEEVEMLDVAFRALVETTGNTTLLKKAPNASNGSTLSETDRQMTFVRQGVRTKSTDNSINTGNGATNSSGTIRFYGDPFTNEDSIIQTVFHELGHNWDQSHENAFVDDFRAVGGWQQFDTDPGAGWEKSSSSAGSWADWYFTDKDGGLDGFAHQYGKKNPKEDFASSFAARMMVLLNRDHRGDGTTNAELVARTTSSDPDNPGRFDVLDNFFESISS